MIEKIDWLAIKVQRIINFPFFAGLMCFAVPMVYFDGRFEDIDSLWNELVDTWVILRDYPLPALFIAFSFLAGFVNIDRTMRDLSFKNEDGEVRSS